METLVRFSNQGRHPLVPESFRDRGLHPFHGQPETRNLKRKELRAKSKVKEAKRNLKPETCEAKQVTRSKPAWARMGNLRRTGVGCRMSGEGSQAQLET